jgi:hypothetical protein
LDLDPTESGKQKKISKNQLSNFLENNAATNCKKILTFFLTAGSFSEFEYEGRYETYSKSEPE